MGKCFLHGGGYTPLGFKIVGGTTQPVNPRENTIWVNTEKEITEWAFATENPYTEPIEGAVWIKTASFSAAPINLLKKNNATIYPNYVYQYVNDELIVKDAIVFKNGEWLELEVVLYNEGVDNEGVTGGWSGSLENLSSNSAEGISIVTTRYTINKIDLTNFTKLTCVLRDLTSTYGYIIVSTTQDETGKVAENATPDYSSGDATLELDISNLDGSYYILVKCATTYGNAGSFSVSKIRLGN